MVSLAHRHHNVLKLRVHRIRRQAQNAVFAVLKSKLDFLKALKRGKHIQQICAVDTSLQFAGGTVFEADLYLSLGFVARAFGPQGYLAVIGNAKLDCFAAAVVDRADPGAPRLAVLGGRTPGAGCSCLDPG